MTETTGGVDPRSHPPAFRIHAEIVSDHASIAADPSAPKFVRSGAEQIANASADQIRKMRGLSPFDEAVEARTRAHKKLRPTDVLAITAIGLSTLALCGLGGQFLWDQLSNK